LKREREMMYVFMNTVKLVYNDHLRDPKIVAIVWRWSLAQV
jgi:hypothetical protein